MPAGKGFEFIPTGFDLAPRLIMEASKVEGHLAQGLAFGTITAEKPIASDPLCLAAGGLAGSELRAIVNYLRRRRVPIASNGHGYFMARDWRELVDTMAQLKSRISGVQAALTGLENAFKPENAPELF